MGEECSAICVSIWRGVSCGEFSVVCLGVATGAVGVLAEVGLAFVGANSALLPRMREANNGNTMTVTAATAPANRGQELGPLVTPSEDVPGGDNDGTPISLK